MDQSSVGQEMKLQEQGITEESTGIDSPPLVKEEHSNSSSCSVASSAYGDLSSGLREKMSISRKDGAGDVMVSALALHRSIFIFMPSTWYVLSLPVSLSRPYSSIPGTWY